MSRALLRRPPRGWSGPYSVIGFVLATSVVNTLVYQWPLLSFAAAGLDWSSVTAAVALATLPVTVFSATTVVLALLAAISMTLCRWACALLAILNALALYFMATYGVVLHREMMGNVVNTRWSEASGFADAGLLLYLLPLGLLPAWVVLRVRLRNQRFQRARALGLACAALILVAAWLWSASSTWLWIDKNAKVFGGLVLPWSYIVNTARFYALQDRTADLVALPDGHFADPDPTVMVLVVGESARARNFSLYGYSRQTNPALERTNAIALPGTRACSTSTREALRCILSPSDPQRPGQGFEPLPTYLQRTGVEVEWRTNNWGEPRIVADRYVTARDLAHACTGPDCTLDDVLLTGLEARIRASAGKLFIVLHLAGSHGPEYFRKHAVDTAAFMPECRTVDLSRCTPAELVNAYDNTLVHTDRLLAALISVLERIDDRRVAMLYISDHGESLGENGIYLHGLPVIIAPDEQLDIPFIVWMSAAFAEHAGVDASQLLARKHHGQRQVFHSVLGGLGISSPVYDPALDIFRLDPEGNGDARPR